MTRATNPRLCGYCQTTPARSDSGAPVCESCWRANMNETRSRHRIQNRQRLRADYREHYRQNRAAILKRNRAWRQHNRDKVLSGLRANYRAQTDAYKARARNRKALKRAAQGTHTAADLVAILKAQGGRCAYCRTKLMKGNCHVDHIIALSKGGTNDRRNLQLTCEPCNLSKHAKDPIEFAQSIGMLI